MKMVEPEHLYKFRSLSGGSKQYVERMVLNQEIYLAKPADFNDPFDCLPSVSLNATTDEFTKYLDGLYKRRMPHLSRKDRRVSIKEIVKDKDRNHRSPKVVYELKRILEKSVNSAGVLSLSENCEHVLMWSHYADSHRGICLRFKVSPYEKYFGEAQKVIYSEARPILNLIKDSPADQMEKALLTKADFWAYEEEWRIIDHISGPGVKTYPCESLDGIILGAKITDEDRATVQKWVSESGRKIELFESRICEKKFRVVINAI